MRIRASCRRPLLRAAPVRACLRNSSRMLDSILDSIQYAVLFAAPVRACLFFSARAGPCHPCMMATMPPFARRPNGSPPQVLRAATGNSTGPPEQPSSAGAQPARRADAADEVQELLEDDPSSSSSPALRTGAPWQRRQPQPRTHRRAAGWQGGQRVQRSAQPAASPQQSSPQPDEESASLQPQLQAGQGS